MKSNKVNKELVISNLSKRGFIRNKFLVEYELTREDCYLIVHELLEPPKCMYCNNNPKFISFSKGHHTICNDKKCINTLRSNTNIHKYGVSNVSKVKEVQQRKQDTLFENYGTRDYLNSDMNRHNMFIGGVHVTRTPEANNKRNNTLIERYGTTDSLSIKDGRTRGNRKCNSCPDVQEKRKNTLLKRYGTHNLMSLKSFQDYIKYKNIQKYGVSNHMMSPEGRVNYDISVTNRLNNICENGLNSFERAAQLARQTNIENGRWLPDDQKDAYYLYRQEVWRYTRQSRPETLDNFNKRGRIDTNGAYNLDHKYSIFQGFVDKVPPYIIGHIHNLEFIPAIDNLSKGRDCSIDIETLLGSILTEDNYEA